MKYYSNYFSTEKRKSNLIFILFILVFLPTSVTKAQKSNSVTIHSSWEKFSISLGGFVTGLNNDIIIGSQKLGLGLSINVEDALGLKTSVFVLRNEILYNFGKRGQQSAKFEYFGFFRNAQKVLESEIEIGDETFPLGSELNSKFNMQIFKGSYCYSFYMDERVKIGASFGLYVMPFSFSTSALGLSEEVMDATIPLPVLGFGFDFAIKPKLILRQSIDVLYLKISTFEGSITDLNVKLEYNIWKHAGFGLGFNTYRMHISNNKENNSLIDLTGDIKTGYTGLQLYGKYYF
jgi:hypothetical protein